MVEGDNRECFGLAVGGVNLQIQRGKTTALVGESGSGKTTLVDIMLGLLKPTSGHVLVDESVVDPVAEQWQDRRICYVGQSVALVPGSVRDNLCLAKPTCSDENIWQALKVVELDAIVGALPDALNARVGEGGTLFSGGELQRLVMARVWLLSPDFLVLDEATSQVDSATERLIMRALSHQVPSRTMLIISHRIASVRDAEMIYVLGRGRVLEAGALKHLMSHESGIFRAISRLQDSQQD